MNEVIKQLYERKSVRVFTEQEIDEAIVQEILTSAVMAPTAGNMQLYTILRISDPEILEKLSVLCDNQPFIAKGKLVLLFQGGAPEQWMLEAGEYTAKRFAALQHMEYLGMATTAAEARTLGASL